MLKELALTRTPPPGDWCVGYWIYGRAGVCEEEGKERNMGRESGLNNVSNWRGNKKLARPGLCPEKRKYDGQMAKLGVAML
jgi:hypothetical protein